MREFIPIVYSNRIIFQVSPASRDHSQVKLFARDGAYVVPPFSTYDPVSVLNGKRQIQLEQSQYNPPPPSKYVIEHSLQRNIETENLGGASLIPSFLARGWVTIYHHSLALTRSA